MNVRTIASSCIVAALVLVGPAPLWAAMLLTNRDWWRSLQRT